MSDSTVLSVIGESVIALEEPKVLELTRQALDSGIAPIAVINEGLTPGMTEVGKLFEEGEYFLPELLVAAEVFKAAVEIVKPHLGDAVETKGKVVLGTVEGDIHDIGKNIVTLMLGNHGFDVVDLGKDVKAADIVEAAERHGARVIGLSALMTTTMVRMEDTVRLVRERGLPVKVMVGGAVVTPAYAEAIGADGYSADAVEAVRVAKELLTVQ